MTLATKRKLAFWLLGIGVVGLIFSIKYYQADERLGELYAEQFGNKLDKTLRAAAGPGATECPHQYVPKAVVISAFTCADAALASNRPFAATYAIESGEGMTYRGLVRTANGNFMEYTWDPGKKMYSLFGSPDPVQVPCIDNKSVRRNWQNVATCTDMH